jgi:hypothetical protein
MVKKTQGIAAARDSKFASMLLVQGKILDDISDEALKAASNKAFKADVPSKLKAQTAIAVAARQAALDAQALDALARGVA